MLLSSDITPYTAFFFFLFVCFSLHSIIKVIREQKFTCRLAIADRQGCFKPTRGMRDGDDGRGERQAHATGEGSFGLELSLSKGGNDDCCRYDLLLYFFCLIFSIFSLICKRYNFFLLCRIWRSILPRW